MRAPRGLVIFLILAVTAGVLGAQRRSIEPVGLFGRRLISLATSPAVNLAAAVRDGLGGSWQWMGDMLRLREDNLTLRREVAVLHRELREREEDRLENERLRRLLTLPAPQDMREMAAHVVGADPTNWFRTIRIDKGERDGVLVDSPVLAAGGLVGHIIEVTAREATVLLLLDANCRVAAIVEDSRAQGLVEGQYERELRLTYVDRNESLAPGDTIVTSGMGGIYPKGLLIGHVLRVTPQENGLFLLASIKPTVDFTRLEEVIVLLPPFADGDPALGDFAAS